MITARLSLRQPDGTVAETRFEVADDNRWPAILDWLEARYGPPVGCPPDSPLDPWVADVMGRPNRPEDAPQRTRARPASMPEGKPYPPSGVRATSRDALHHHAASGKLGRQEMAVYGYIRGHHGEDFTRQEVAAGLGMGINAVTGRVFALIHDHGLLRETRRRQCRITGESAMPVTATEAP